ncbi:MAG: hypothetical protein AB4352_18895 [Hormoscilla sp.]
MPDVINLMLRGARAYQMQLQIQLAIGGHPQEIIGAIPLGGRWRRI